MTIFANLPRLYPIVDAGLLAQAGISIQDFAHALRRAGVRFLQYRDKDGSDGAVLEHAALLRSIFPASDSCLILNDRVALSGAAGFEGVHVGQDDMPPAQAREILGREALIGVSTHDQRQLLSAGDRVDYIAVGPVFATSSKENPDPAIGLEGVRNARQLTDRPLVAIGGITRANCLAVRQAGADSVAVISDLLPRAGESIEQLAAEFSMRLRGGDG